MKVSLSLEGNRQEILDQLAEFKTVIETSLDNQKPAATAKPPKGKATAKAKKAEAVDEEEEFDLDAGESDDAADEVDLDDDSDDLDSEDDDADDGEKPTIDGVIKAFQKFAGKKTANKAKAKAILAKFKVASVRELKEKHFQQALDLIDGA